jgi:hypothetical protein
MQSDKQKKTYHTVCVDILFKFFHLVQGPLQLWDMFVFSYNYLANQKCHKPCQSNTPHNNNKL